MHITRKNTKALQIGPLSLGANAPIRVQSMTNTNTKDLEATAKQIDKLVAAGCELVRLAVPDKEAAFSLKTLCSSAKVPLIADIHFDYRLAILALEAGCMALRINPGNLEGKEQVKAVVDAAKAHKAAIRVGVNSGSLPKDLLEKYGAPSPQAMVDAALRHVRLLEDWNFSDTKISLKSSSVLHTIEAYRLLSRACEYPLHLGVTEAGSLVRGTVKSSLGIGLLLAQGIGDTFRVSLTADPLEEVPVAWEILRALGLRKRGPEIISCPTCGRTEIDIMGMVDAVERHVQHIAEPISIAVMGCVVNGPGEAKEADIGLAGGRDRGVIFAKGETVRTVRGQEALLAAFLEILDDFLEQYRKEDKHII